MSEWIKCSERMPMAGQEVLAIDEFGNYEACQYSQSYLGTGPHFFSSADVFDATHWQPLPGPPQD